MRKSSIILIAGLLTLTQARCQPQRKTSGKLQKLAWLKGTWQRTDTEPGQSGHERWIEVSPSEMKGWGVSMKGVDTAFVEKLKIIVEKDKIYYVSDVPENKQPVYFTITEITDTGFTCENPQHDFPKKIAYWKEGDKLSATISGDGKEFTFLFTKK
jgi:hypothetical protein